MQVGDNVNYVPDQCHALIPNMTDHPEKGIVRGDYPWVIGFKERGGEVREITGVELSNRLKALKRGRKGFAQEGLEFIRPKISWPAVVTAVRGDEVDLDVDAPNSAVTLHVTVKVDPTGKKPHTCHELVEAAAEEPVAKHKPVHHKPAEHRVTDKHDK